MMASARSWFFAACFTFVCGGVRVSAEDTGAQGSELLGLVAVQGRLLPDFRSDVTRYAIDLQQNTENLELKRSVPAGASLRVDGKRIDANVPWRSRRLERAETIVSLEVSRPGAAPRTYELRVRRGRLPIELQVRTS